MSSYLEKLEADRQAQHSGYGIQSYLCADGSRKWEAYGWERTTELSIHTTSYGLFDHKWEAYGWERTTELSIHTTSYGIFDHKWQAEQYFNSIING